MRAGMALPVSPLIDKTGFRVIDLTGGGNDGRADAFTATRITGKGSTAGRIDARTPCAPGLRANANVTFAVTPDALMDLWVRRLCAHGVRVVLDLRRALQRGQMLRLRRSPRRAKAEVAGAMMFALSPVHTDEYYAHKADMLSASPDVDTLLLYDTAAVLEKEPPQDAAARNRRQRSWQEDRIPFQQSPRHVGQAYSTAIELGVSVLHTASRRWPTARRCRPPRSCRGTSS